MSLVEVLASLALLGAVAPALSRAWVVTMTSAGRSTTEMTAVGLAENKLAQVIAQGAPPTVEESGDFAPEHPGYNWRCERYAWPADNRLSQLDVTVTWTRRGREFSTTVSTLVAAGER